MFSKDTQRDGKYYLRGLLIDILGSSETKTDFTHGIEKCNISDIDGNNNIFCHHYNYQSKLKPSPALLDRFKNSENDDQYIYHVYGLDVKTFDDNMSIFITAPSQEILELVRPASNLCEYVKCDLLKICSDQFKGSLQNEVTITRLNARLVGDSGDAISSVAFYGNNVIQSQIINKVLGIGNKSNELSRHDPFASEQDRFTRSELLDQDRFINPKSIRLKWNNGKDKPVSLNIDIFGNFSLYYHDGSTFKGISHIFRYLESIKSFVPNVTADPLRRSSRALEIVAS